MISRTDNNSQVYNTEPVETLNATSGASTAQAIQADGSAPILPDPVQQMASGGDLLAELEALLTLASRSDRDAARKGQRAEDMVRNQKEQQKVDKMHEQANDILGSAWASGLADIGQGACAVGGSLTKEVACKFDWNDAFQVTGIGFKASGEIAEGQFKAAEKLDAAGAEEAGAGAERAGRGAKEADEDVQNARELLKKVASFYEQMLQLRSATLNAAANMRG